MIKKTDVFVLGAGAGGIGCIYSLIKSGLKVVVCDKNSGFGGTMVHSGVCCWEPGVSLPGIHELLAKELGKYGAHCAKTVSNTLLFQPKNADDEEDDMQKYPWALSVMDYDTDYSETLYGYGCRDMKLARRFQFDDMDFEKAIENVFLPYKENLTTYFNTSLSKVNIEEGKIKSVELSDGTIVFAGYFVDASGDIILARKCGCEYAFGTDGNEVYQEPSAKKTTDIINDVTYIFRISKCEDENYIDTIPDEYKVDKPLKFETVSCFNTYPNGDININMLPTMSGREYFSLGEDADKKGRLIVWNYWNYLQKEKGLKGYKLVKIYNAGVREGYRLVGRKVLTENDIRKGLDNTEGCIAVADHTMDIHGEGGLAKFVSRPYGVHIDCCRPKEYDNLFVSCRGASFSHIGLSSARLSRTMLSMGEGVGEYIKMLMVNGTEDISKINQTQKFIEYINKQKFINYKNQEEEK